MFPRSASRMSMFSKTDIPNDSDRQLSQKVFGLSRVQFLRGGLEEMHLQDKQSNQKLTFSGLHPLTAEVTLLLGGGEGDQETSVQNPTVMKCTVCFLCK